jgi:hypothetical protein
MGQTYPSRSLASFLAGAAVVATVLGCGGASATFPEKDASTADVPVVGSNGSSGSGDETGATSSSGGGSSSGGPSDDAAMSSSDSGGGSVVEAGDASGTIAGSEAGDGKDAALMEGGTSECAAICEGCCDINGKCVTGGTVAVCGKNGASCEDCSKDSCIVSSAPCCTTAGKCGCAVAGFVACD